jgi:putative SOS response-associated peptidase YedK
MCNLYSITKSQDAIRRLFRVERDSSGNLPPIPDVFPDTMAPVVRNAKDGARELTMMRWGFPPPPNLGTRPVTNIRNTKSPYWRGWLKSEFRCLVPATSFCEWTDKPPKVTHWFALDELRPLFAFAGIWRPWTGMRKKEEREHLLFSFLTTDSNDAVRPIHAKAMPVMLTEPSEFDAWLSAPVEEALQLQRPLPAERLRIVATAEKLDPAPETGALRPADTTSKFSN